MRLFQVFSPVIIIIRDITKNSQINLRPHSMNELTLMLLVANLANTKIMPKI